MTQLIDTAPFAIRRLSLPHVKFPKLGIGATIAAVSTSITHAYSMAYVEPFRASLHQPPVSSDSDLEGRDPSW